MIAKAAFKISEVYITHRQTPESLLEYDLCRLEVKETEDITDRKYYRDGLHMQQLASNRV